MGYDFFANQVHALGIVRGLFHRVTVFGRAIKHWKIKDFIRRFKLDKKIKYLIENPIGVGGRFIDFIDDYDDR